MHKSVAFIGVGLIVYKVLRGVFGGIASKIGIPFVA